MIKTKNLVVIAKKKKADLRKIFGAHKFKKTTEQLMKETDSELYD